MADLSTICFIKFLLHIQQKITEHPMSHYSTIVFISNMHEYLIHSYYKITIIANKIAFNNLFYQQHA
jgi:hypothetical protein